MIGGLAIRTGLSVETVAAHVTKRAESFGVPAIRTRRGPFFQNPTALAAELSWHVHYVTFGAVHHFPLLLVFLGSLELKIQKVPDLLMSPTY